MNIPQINENDIQQIQQKKGDGMPFAVKLLLFIVFTLGSTIATVVPSLVKKNDKLVEERDNANIRCDQEKQNLLNAERIRTFENNRYKDSIISGLNRQMMAMLDERIKAIKQDIRSLNKELK